MTVEEFAQLKEYLSGKPKILDIKDLPDRDRRSCSIMQNTINDSRDIMSHNYKTKTDLANGVLNAIHHIRVEVRIRFESEHKDINLHGISLVEAMKFFEGYPLTTYEEGCNYLKDVSDILVESLNTFNLEIAEGEDVNTTPEQLLFMEALLYLVALSINNLNSVNGKPSIIEGVGISATRRLH